ncbi:MAG: hypothetical protein ACYCZD_03335 [Rhodanobacter sp.]
MPGNSTKTIFAACLCGETNFRHRDSYGELNETLREPPAAAHRDARKKILVEAAGAQVDATARMHLAIRKPATVRKNGGPNFPSGRSDHRIDDDDADRKPRTAAARAGNIPACAVATCGYVDGRAGGRREIGQGWGAAQ